LDAKTPHASLVVVEDFVGDGVEVSDGLHGGESFQVGLHLGPLPRVFLGFDGRLRVGVVGEEVVLELSRHDVGWCSGDHVQEFGVGLVGETIAAGFDDDAGVKIAVGDVVVDGVEVGEDTTKASDGAVDAFDVEVFGRLVGAFDGEKFEGADFGKDEDEASIEMAADAGMLAVGLPVVVFRGLAEIGDEEIEVRAWDVVGKVLFVEDGLGAGDVGEEATDGIAIDTNGRLPGADDVR
jgi:hypothetical protein